MMTAQRMRGNTCTALAFVSRLCPSAVRLGLIGVYPRSGDTFDLVTAGRNEVLAQFLIDELMTNGVATVEDE